MLLGKTSPRTWLIFTLLISLLALSEPRQKRSPKDSPRRADDESDANNDEKKSKATEDSNESNSDTDSFKKNTNKEQQYKAEISDESNSDDNNDDSFKLQSTRGLKPEDFEPEESHKGNSKNAHVSDDESAGSSRRRRRSIKELNLKGIEEPIDKLILRKLSNQ